MVWVSELGEEWLAGAAGTRAQFVVAQSETTGQFGCLDDISGADEIAALRSQ